MINPGDVVTVSTDPGFSLGDVGQTPADPTTVKLVWYRKGDPPTTWTYPTNITKDETGKFHADIPIAKAGTYHFRWVGSGSVDAAEEGTFESVSAFGGAS